MSISPGLIFGILQYINISNLDLTLSRNLVTRETSILLQKSSEAGKLLIIVHDP